MVKSPTDNPAALEAAITKALRQADAPATVASDVTVRRAYIVSEDDRGLVWRTTGRVTIGGVRHTFVVLATVPPGIGDGFDLASITVRDRMLRRVAQQHQSA